VLTAIVVAAAGGAAGSVAGALAEALADYLKSRGSSPADRGAPRAHSVRTRSLVVGGALGLVTTIVVLVWLALDSGPSLTIYSSLAQRRTNGEPNQRTHDMEQAIRLALRESDNKAGKFTIKYVALNSTDETGAFLPQKIKKNAEAAAGNDETAVYIGDFSSSASIESIPILSKAGVPQISPTSTRVGLTVDDPLSDIDEPERYYRGGSRNFVRVIPNDDVQAAALGALMKKDRCGKVATIYDGQDYSQGLSVLMRLIGPRRSFSEDVRPKERSRRYEELAEKAKRGGVDCFLYMGADNPNTFGIFDAFARVLPNARLYGTDGVSEASLTDPGGNLGGFANRVKLMVPPRDLVRNGGFRREFANAHDGDFPDSYAIYGYEATKLALDAIKASGSGTRADILEQLKSTKERDSPLGTYSIDSSGDTSLTDYDVLTFAGGKSNLAQAVAPDALQAMLDVLDRRK
jgi:branched-chain amino acid transport system substrate-binding protein